MRREISHGGEKSRALPDESSSKVVKISEFNL